MLSLQAGLPFLCITSNLFLDVCDTCPRGLAAFQTHPFHPSNASLLNWYWKKKIWALLPLKLISSLFSHRKPVVVIFPIHTSYISARIRYLSAYATPLATTVPSLALYLPIAYLSAYNGKRLGLEAIDQMHGLGKVIQLCKVSVSLAAKLE